MLGALSAVMPPQRSVSALDYANGELRVKGLALGAQELQGPTSVLRGQGYSAVLQSDTLSISTETLP